MWFWPSVWLHQLWFSFSLASLVQTGQTSVILHRLVPIPADILCKCCVPCAVEWPRSASVPLPHTTAPSLACAPSHVLHAVHLRAEITINFKWKNHQHHHHHHHHISFMELGHLLTHSGLTYPEVSSKVYHDSCTFDILSATLHGTFYSWMIIHTVTHKTLTKQKVGTNWVLHHLSCTSHVI